MLILRSHQHKQKNWLISSHEEFKIGQNDMYLQVWHLADQYRQWKSNNLTSIRLVKGKGHKPKAKTAGAYTSFLSMKHAYSVGVLLHPPWLGAQGSI